MLNKLIIDAECQLENNFSEIDNIALINQQKILNAFKKNEIALRHFTNTNGYAYGDSGREKLNQLYADVLQAESAIVSNNICSGTHALTIALFGLLRPNDTFISISGIYDTLESVINGSNDSDIGSLKDFNINHIEIKLLPDNSINYNKLRETLISKKIKLVFIQRSRGYSWRNALSLDDISEIVNCVKSISPDTIALVDNCYGEFVDTNEPTQVGADIIVGSLIKNIGGGLAPTGGYIAGKNNLVSQCGNRLTAPSIATEIGCNPDGYQYYYQGLFMAPHIVCQALKSCMLFSAVYSIKKYETLPQITQKPNDIICSIKFGNKEKLIDFCTQIQYSSPIDSFVTPLPWAMPGYNDEVIMAAGCFIQGSSIELSCDAPIKEPYIAYLQGALTYEHAKLTLNNCLDKF